MTYTTPKPKPLQMSLERRDRAIPTARKWIRRTTGITLNNQGACHHVTSAYRFKSSGNYKTFAKKAKKYGELRAKQRFGELNGLYEDVGLLCRDLFPYEGWVALARCKRRVVRDSARFSRNRKEASDEATDRVFKFLRGRTADIAVTAALSSSGFGAKGGLIGAFIAALRIAQHTRKEANGGYCRVCKHATINPKAAFCRRGIVYESREDAERGRWPAERTRGGPRSPRSHCPLERKPRTACPRCPRDRKLRTACPRCPRNRKPEKGYASTVCEQVRNIGQIIDVIPREHAPEWCQTTARGPAT